MQSTLLSCAVFIATAVAVAAPADPMITAAPKVLLRRATGMEALTDIGFLSEGQYYYTIKPDAFLSIAGGDSLPKDVLDSMSKNYANLYSKFDGKIPAASYASDALAANADELSGIAAEVSDGLGFATGDDYVYTAEPKDVLAALTIGSYGKDEQQAVSSFYNAYSSLYKQHSGSVHLTALINEGGMGALGGALAGGVAGAGAVAGAAGAAATGSGDDNSEATETGADSEASETGDANESESQEATGSEDSEDDSSASETKGSGATGADDSSATESKGSDETGADSESATEAAATGKDSDKSSASGSKTSGASSGASASSNAPSSSGKNAAGVLVAPFYAVAGFGLVNLLL
ncbi:hypothetical protein DICA1_C04544 [Diutina catenulata]